MGVWLRVSVADVVPLGVREELGVDVEDDDCVAVGVRVTVLVPDAVGAWLELGVALLVDPCDELCEPVGVEAPEAVFVSEGVSVPLGVPDWLLVDSPLRVCEDVTEAVGVAVEVGVVAPLAETDAD